MSEVHYETVVKFKNRDVFQGVAKEYVEVAVTVSTPNKTMHDDIIAILENYDARRPGKGSR